MSCRCCYCGRYCRLYCHRYCGLYGCRTVVITVPKNHLVHCLFNTSTAECDGANIVHRLRVPRQITCSSVLHYSYVIASDIVLTVTHKVLSAVQEISSLHWSHCSYLYNLFLCPCVVEVQNAPLDIDYR